MADSPPLDRRAATDLDEQIREIAPAYVDEWDPESDDVGNALVALFAESADGVLERLNRVPDKQFVAFLDALGFDRRPPQSARLPLSLTVTEDAPRNVVVPEGTQATAEATDARSELTFEFEAGEGFEATPSRLVDLLSVDPDPDQLFDHSGLLPDADRGDDEDGSSDSTTGGSAPTVLFTGADEQSHALYIGHPELLDLPLDALDPPSSATVRVGLRTTAPAALLSTRLVWQYYGEKVPTPGDEPVEGWHTLTPAGATPAAPEADLIEEVVTELDTDLRVAGYEPAELGPAARATLHERIAVEVFERGQQLPPSLLPTATVDDALAESIRSRVRAALAAAPPVPSLGSKTLQTLSFTLDGTPTEHEVGGVKSLWLRACVPAGRVPRRAFDISYTEVSLGLGVGSLTLTPDQLLADDVPLPSRGSVDELPVVPFGEEPQATNAFYIASTGALTKRGRQVTLSFVRTTDDSAPPETPATVDLAPDPELSWEYWDGDAWERLPLESDDTKRLTEAGDVLFTVPDDLEPTTVSGHEGHWIRVRLTDGHYGRATFTEGTSSTGVPFYRRDTTGILEPRYEAVEFRLTEAGDPATTPAHVLHENALALESVPAAPSTPARPFQPLADETQTLYLGFRGSLSNGPIALFFAATDSEFPVGFYPRVRWEALGGPDHNEWLPLGTEDGTESLTERGVVRLTFSGETTPSTLFGRTRHWVRARTRGDQFVGTLYVPAGPVGAGTGGAGRRSSTSGMASALGADRGTGDGDGDCCGGSGRRSTTLPACGVTVPTLPPAGLPTPAPPSVTGLHPNTGWASNVRTVQRESVGSSDGTPSQRFAVSTPPVLDATVEVDELTARSEEGRETLLADQPDRVELVTGPDGAPRRFWVVWDEVPDFLDVGPADRAYVVDRTAGTIRFGDGRAGMIPPIGRDNVRVTYGTGGGAAGNVAAGGVTDLVSSLAFVDEVTNPVAGDGGADVETTAAVLDRGPKELRDRNRAVVDVDYERLARAASRKLARTRCFSAMNRAGVVDPGWVTLLVVPASGEAKPTPSAELRGQVERYVAERAPATLVAGDRLVVRGPSYVAASVETELVVTPGTSVSTVEAAATEALAAFLHPLTGGPTDEGWPFGVLPCRADLYAQLERVAGVDHVAALTLRFRGSGAAVTATEGEDPPSVAPDALVYSGTHDVTATGGR